MFSLPLLVSVPHSLHLFLYPASLHFSSPLHSLCTCHCSFSTPFPLSPYQLLYRPSFHPLNVFSFHPLNVFSFFLPSSILPFTLNFSLFQHLSHSSLFIQDTTLNTLNGNCHAYSSTSLLKHLGCCRNHNTICYKWYLKILLYTRERDVRQTAMP